MRRLDLSFPLLALLLAALQFPATTSAAKPKDAILLSEVQSLTLRGDAKTTHRRVSPIPQLKCISSPSICALYKIDRMRCVNQGSSYSSEDVQWSCTASLPRELKLGSTDVICEGYANRDDPYVLRGSCGVEYRLVLTEEGEKRHPDLASGWHSGGKTSWGSYIVMFIFVALLAVIVYSACFAEDAGARRRPFGRGGWGGWGGGPGPGWGPGNDPPPPYPGKPGSQWQPGFWTGLAGGAAAGYFAGNRGNQRDRDYYDQPPRWGYDRGSSSSFAGPSSSSSSSSRHESTGFGSTSRR